MINSKYNCKEIFEELKSDGVLDSFVAWASNIYPNIHLSQPCFESCYEIYKLNENFLKKNGIKNNVYLTIPAFLRVFFFQPKLLFPMC